MMSDADKPPSRLVVTTPFRSKVLALPRSRNLVIAPVGSGKSIAALAKHGYDIDSITIPPYLEKELEELKSANDWPHHNTIISALAVVWRRSLPDDGKPIYVHNRETAEAIFLRGDKIVLFLLPLPEWTKRVAELAASKPARAEAMISNRGHVLTDARTMRLPRVTAL